MAPQLTPERSLLTYTNQEPHFLNRSALSPSKNTNFGEGSLLPSSSPRFKRINFAESSSATSPASALRGLSLNGRLPSSQSTSVVETFKTPPTPMKVRSHVPQTPNKPRRQNFVINETNFQRVNKAAINGCLFFQECNYNIAKITGAKGDFLQAYHVIDENQLIQDVDNSEIIVKVFHEEKSSKSQKNMTHSLSQYSRLISYGLPVSTIYNAGTALEDGFYIVENLPGTISIDSWKGFEGCKFTDLSSSDQTILKEIRNIFIQTLTNREVMDFALGNLRLNKEGEVTIADFREKKQNSSWGLANSLVVTMREGITKWSGDNPHIHSFLSEGGVKEHLEQLDAESQPLQLI